MPFRDRPPTGLQRMTTRRVIPENISEAAFQSYVVEAAAWHGWKTFHPRTVRTFKGNHLTAYQGDAGFPDLVLAHDKRGVIFAELKTQKGRMSTGQQLWRLALESGGAEYHLWRPSDWWDIEKRLRTTP